MSHFRKSLNGILAFIALFSVELLIVMAIFVVSVIIFLFVSNEIFYEKEEGFDYRAYQFAQSISSPAFTRLMKAITFMASMQFVPFAALACFVYFLFVKKHHWYSIKIPVVCIGSISLNLILKNLFDRPRPLFPHLVEAFGLSFPSGHAMISFSFYGLLIYMVYVFVKDPRLKWPLIICLLVLIHLIGFSRVYLGVHYASDVMAGFALGVIWLILSIFVLKKIEKISARKIHPEEDPFD